MEPKGTATIKKGKDKRLRGGYPWVPKSEIKEVIGVTDGELAVVLSENGDNLGLATYNSQSRFPLRIISRNQIKISETWFKNKFDQAIQKRHLFQTITNATRICFAEADHVPGLIVDNYNQHLVVQVRSLGMESLKHLWIPALLEATQAKSILERSDMPGRAEEGLDQVVQSLYRTPPDSVEIEEHGHIFHVPIKSGLKTGYYLDQRNSRKRLADLIKPGENLLDCFCYSGGFSIYAAKSGANCTAVDISEIAIQTAELNAKANGLNISFQNENVFDLLEKEPDTQYDWIILDPPAISKTSEDRDSLKWAVWNLVHRALPHLKTNGRLIVCSCSYQLNLDGLINVTKLAAQDRQTELELEDITLQDLDHPAPLFFPESLYLKCIWLRKTT